MRRISLRALGHFRPSGSCDSSDTEAERCACLCCLEGNEHAFCPNCYCVKCQVPASECKEWAEHATIAKKKKPLKTYRTDRQLLRESRAYGIGADTAERSKRARKAPGRYDPNVDGLSDRQRNARARNL